PRLPSSTLFPYTTLFRSRREVETIFLKEWNFLGRADRVPHPGDYFAVTFAGVPVIVIRGKDGELRAFANTCRHRGTTMLQGEGRSEEHTSELQSRFDLVC